MGKMPSPAKIAVDLQGDSSNRRKHYVEPTAPSGSPNKPQCIVDDPVASDAWDQAVNDLDSMGILSTVDGRLLEMYSTAYSRYRHVDEEIRVNGVGDGKQTSAAFRARNSYVATITKCLTLMGMTPAARRSMRMARIEADAAKWHGIIP